MDSCLLWFNVWVRHFEKPAVIAEMLLLDDVSPINPNKIGLEKNNM